jgi:glycine/D-amino acid oxidase-like deaminating enzyme
MTVSFWQDRSKEQAHEVDVLVVGAGISGASTAYWLAKEGNTVAVVDSGEVASGASGRSGGMLLLGTADPYGRVADLYGRERASELWAFTLENRKLLEEHILGSGELDAQLRLVRNGTASAAVSEHEMKELERAHQMMGEDGHPQELLNRDRISQAMNASPAFHGALLDPAGMTIDPRRLTARILSLAEQAGALLFDQHPVFRMEENEDGVRVWTSRGIFTAQMVLLCTNAYSPLLDGHFEEKVYATRGQMLATEPIAKIMDFGVYADFGYEYFWQLTTGEVVAGGWAEKGYSDETTRDIQSGIWEFMTRCFPALEGVEVTHRWGGVMGFSGDGLPFIGDLPGRPRIKYLCGHTGHGLGFSFHAAKKFVAAALDGEPVGWLGAGRQGLS